MDILDVAERVKGTRCIVTKLSAQWVTVRAASGDTLTVHWDAVTAATTPEAALAACSRHAGPCRPSLGDYVLIRANARELAEAAQSGWHPDMDRLVDTWALVVATGNTFFSVCKLYDHHAFPYSCVAERVRASDLLG